MIMRLLILAVLLSMIAPAEGGSNGQCKSRCDSSYQYCMARAANKQARKICKTDRKLCKSGCR